MKRELSSRSLENWGAVLCTLASIAALASCQKAAAPAAPAPAAPSATAAIAAPATPAAAAATPAEAAAPKAGPGAPLVGTPVELGGTSKSGKYAAKLRFIVPQVGEMFGIDALANLADGSPLPGDAKVAVDATMPEHRHGMMTDPETKQVNPAKWRAEGMKLHMHGNWMLHVKITTAQGTDEVELPFVQPPEAVPGQ